MWWVVAALPLLNPPSLNILYMYLTSFGIYFFAIFPFCVVPQNVILHKFVRSVFNSFPIAGHGTLQSTGSVAAPLGTSWVEDRN